MRVVCVCLLTWYFVRRVLQTPVNSIMATRNGMRARAGITGVAIVAGGMATESCTGNC
jgi:hypothetical protein